MRRVLAIMGSGETTPTMVTPHQQILGRLGDGADAVLLDTPYGFQENAGEITDRALTYFRRNVGHEVRAVSLRRAGVDPLADEAATADVRAADWVFAGPGSPTYLLRQWAETGIPEALSEKLRAGGAVVFASAAACTLGRHAVPVYEVYKVGEDPHWLDGLDVVAELELDAVVIPHFDNAEGGTHDTRYCYLGERRLARLEQELDPSTFVLGVDEHTVIVVDVTSGRVQVQGRGGVTVRTPDGARWFGEGSDLTVEGLRAAAVGVQHDSTPAAPPAGDRAPTVTPDRTPFLEDVEALRIRFDDALDEGDPLAAGEAALELVELIRDWSADTQQSDEMDRAHAALRQMVVRLARLARAGLHDHRDVVAPFVAALLDVRDTARDQQRFDVADEIRDHLTAAGVEVHDLADGTTWDYDPDRR